MNPIRDKKLVDGLEAYVNTLEVFVAQTEETRKLLDDYFDKNQARLDSTYKQILSEIATDVFALQRFSRLVMKSLIASVLACHQHEAASDQADERLVEYTQSHGEVN